MNEPVKRARGRPRKIPLEQQADVSARVVGSSEQPGQPQAERSSTPAALRVHIYPSFGDADNGDGGIRRVVEAQIKYLPQFGIEIVKTAEEADVIAYHATCPSTYIKLYPQKAFVAICHGMYWEGYEWENWAIKANAEVIEGIRVGDSVATCSEWVANAIRRHTSRNVSVIPHGVENEEWVSNLEHKNFVLWNKTRPDPICDPEPMNQVASLLPNVKFISTFGEEAPNVALTGRLSFEDSKKLIQQAGVYLCTTRETFGIGTLEALACGVPVVGFDWGGQAEFIEHGVDGWLVTPGDIRGLAEGVLWALQNRIRIGNASREKASNFTWENSCENYASLFKETYAKKNKSGPRTSIIVTNYNLHAYLTECLATVQAQTESDWECIVIDDASPDKSGIAIAKDFVKYDPRFRLIENQKNVYLAEARNIGIREAKGRYILPLDADDMLAPDAVTILADALDNDRSIHVAYGNVKFVDEDGVTPTDYGGTPGYSSWPFQFIHEQQIQQRNLLPYCSMYRKEAWELTGGYRRRCRTAEDADFWTRLSSYGFRPKMVSHDDTLIYRNRTGSMSREQGTTDWIRWFSWSKLPTITPAGAVTKEQVSVSSLDPTIISVIIPVGLGHEKIVADAIDSVDTQTFRNWECIVVNDTGKPLETELPSWVRVLATEGKTGPAHARNVGIKASRGRLFLPLDADDYLQPDALQFMFDAHQQYKEVIYSDFWETDMTGKKITIHYCDDYDPYLIKGSKRVVDGIVREGMMHSVTALTPKVHWESVGGYDESLPGWEDWDFQIALGDIGVCSQRIAAPLFVYRKEKGLRREENFNSFDTSKEGILSKWRDIWEGGKDLMACSSCGARARQTIGIPRTAVARMKPNAEAVLIQYNGSKMGATPFRGVSKTVYWFAAGDIKYVLAEDVPGLLVYSEFKQVNQEVQQVQQEELQQPVLVADGPPSG